MRLTTDQMRQAIPLLHRRIEDLQALNPAALTERRDPKFEAVESKVNHTLRDIFGADTVEYNEYRIMLDTAEHNYAYEVPMHEIVAGYQRGIASAVAALQAIVELFDERLRVEALPEAETRREEPRSRPGRKVFVVHGHDEAAKQELARFLEALMLQPVVLHEQANEGQTIIEKFEKHAGTVRFAVVLLTPDDIGYPVGDQAAARPRVRQNVILEFGFFVSELGREHVVALVKGDVEIPSDLHGLLYEKMDAGGAWKYRVANEMRSAGIEIDMNKI